MKNTVFLFITLLILWIAGCTYFYVCKVRNDCRVDTQPIEATLPVQKTDTLSSPVLQPQPPAMLSVYFDFAKTTTVLTEDEKLQLDLFGKYLAENPESKIVITGHSDNIGTPKAKSKVSLARAEFAKQKLLESGIDAARIDHSGKGDSEPAGDNSTPEGLAKNRRAEIQIK